MDEQEQINDNEQQHFADHRVENNQEDDALVEENVTPFFNLGDDLQQTFHRLGIEIPQNIITEHQF